MQLEAKKYLADMVRAADQVARFTAGKRFEDYAADELLRSAVERAFTVLGEALACLRKIDEPAASRISEHRRIVAFRNILIHGYAEIDHRLVWDIVVSKLPALRTDVAQLLASG